MSIEDCLGMIAAAFEDNSTEPNYCFGQEMTAEELN